MKHKYKMQNNGCGTVIMATAVALLTAVFAALKLSGVISWSWIAVLSPLWIYVFGILLIVAVLILINEIGSEG